MRDSMCTFFQIQGISHNFRTFKTEILHIYSLTGQILKQLSPQCWWPALDIYLAALQLSKINIHH